MESLTLNATSRELTGRQARQVRNAGQLPAVIYGHGLAARSLAIPAADFRKVYAKAGTSSLVDVKVDSDAPVKALIQEVQVHHLTLQPIHADFHQVRMDEKMHARVPLKFTGEPAAVKELGGTFVKTMDAVEVECLPADLPHEIEVDISSLKTFDDALSVSDLKLPSGVKVLDNAKQTMAMVEAPLTEEELKKLEESQLGDVTAVKSEAELKKAEEEAKAAAAAPTAAGEGEKTTVKKE